MRPGALACALVVAATVASADVSYDAGIVALSVTSQSWDEERPWEKSSPSSRRINAVVVDGPYLLTGAQMLEDATLIQAEKFGRARRVPARVLLADPEVDLALVQVDDPSFFADLKPVRLAEGTPLDGTLRTVRWRNQQLEISASRIKRYEVQESFFGQLRHMFLLVQTDLSGGGWCEPVFAQDGLVGITVAQDEQSARVIPVEILAAFLDRARAGSYTGFPDLGVKTQVNEDGALARFLGQTGERAGILVRQVPWGSTGFGVLEPRDLLLSLDGQPLDASGYYRHPRFGRLEIAAMLSETHRVGDAIPAQVLRQGKVVDVRLTLRAYPATMDLVPVRRGDDPPPYLVAGGLVLRELDGDYLRSWGRDWMKKAPMAILSRYLLERSAQAPGRRRVVILQAVLPSAYNIGYQDLSNLPVKSINGNPVDSIAAAAEAFRSPKGGFHTIELLPGGDTSLIVLDAARFDEATRGILEEYGIHEAVRVARTPPPDAGAR